MDRAVDRFDPPPPRLGGKGTGLARLARGGLPVPPGCCLPGDAYLAARDATPGWQRARDEAAGILAVPATERRPGPRTVTPPLLEAAASVLTRWADAVRLPQAAVDELRRACAGLTPPLAVRSSAWIEDRPGGTAAGLWPTRLGVRGADGLLDAVVQCWRRLWSPAALEALLRELLWRSGSTTAKAATAPTAQPETAPTAALGAAPAAALAAALDRAYMAVVLQEQVGPVVAGVAFSHDPGGRDAEAAGSADAMAVGAAWGLGRALVGGLVAGDLYRLGRTDGRLLEARPGPKPVEVVPLPDGGVEERPVSPAKATVPCLDEGQLRRIRRLVLDVEAAWEGPDPHLDIEWALGPDGRLFLLQAREALAPTRGTTPRRDREAPGAAGPDDSPPAATPARTGHPGTTASAAAALETAIRGRAPLLPLHWQQPDLAWTKWSMEHVHKAPRTRCPLRRSLLDPIMQRAELATAQDGGSLPPRLLYLGGYAFRGPATSELPPGVTPPRPSEAVQRLVRAARAAGPDERYRLWHDEVRPYLDDTASPLFAARWEDAPLPAVQRDYRRFLQLVVEQWLLHFALEDRGLARLRDFCRHHRVLDDRACLQLVLGRDTLATDLSRRLRRLGGLVAASPSLWEDFAVQAAAGWATPDQLQRHASFWARFEDLLTVYGRQLAAGEDLLSATWSENPRPALQGIHGWAQAIRGGNAGLPEGEAKAGRLADEARRRLAVGSVGSGGGEAVAEFDRLLAAARRSRTYLEDHHYLLDQASLALIRRVHLGLGERFRRRGPLERADDTLFCYLDEILGLLGLGTALPPAPDVITWRREFHGLWSRRPVVRHIGGTRVPVIAGRGADRLTGAGASPGRHAGRAVIVTGDRPPGNIAPGDVLVCPLLLPSWAWVLPLAGAVVADGGSILSHGAILVREAGIPAVFATGWATRAIPDGCPVSVDGDAGVVTFAPPAAEGMQGLSPERDRTDTGRPFPSEWQDPADRHRPWRLWHDLNRGPDTPLAAGLLALALAPADRPRCRSFDGFWYLTGRGAPPPIRVLAADAVPPPDAAPAELAALWRNLAGEDVGCWRTVGELSQREAADVATGCNHMPPLPERPATLARWALDALAAAGIIGDATDGWFLTPPEVAALLAILPAARTEPAAGSTPDLTDLLAARRAEHRLMTEAAPPRAIAAVPQPNLDREG